MQSERLSAKEFFREILELDEYRWRLESLKQYSFDMATNISSPMGGHIGGKQNGLSRVEIGAVKAVDLQQEIDATLEKMEALRAKYRDIIKQIPQWRYRQLLTMRYVKCYGWITITKELGYKSEGSAYIAHGYALKEAQKIMLTQMT